MTASLYDSAIYRALFHDAEVGKLFTDTAEVRAMMLVEGALAKAQGEIGLIPEVSARAIHRASMELQIDPAGLAEETGRSAVVVPALVSAFRNAMQAPEHGQHLHWGATSQDIMETGLVLRLRQVLSLCEQRMVDLIHLLGSMAEEHADLPMAGRTYGQTASPVSFGQVVASWGRPLLRHHERLQQMKPRLLVVSLSGAAGTLSAMGPQGPEVRAKLTDALGLSDPGSTWHSERDRIAEFSAWCTLVTGSLGKMGEDLLSMTQSGIGEVSLSQGGGSSTMPQKSNPVLPSLLVALATQVQSLNSAMQSATVHRHQRDGAAWFVEWLSLPQICMGLARSLAAASEVAAGLTPNPRNMAAGLDDGSGLIYAEALSFALARDMPRPDAQAEVKALCAEVKNSGVSLADLAVARWPDHDWGDLFTPQAQLGTAPDEARTFARQATGLRCESP